MAIIWQFGLHRFASALCSTQFDSALKPGVTKVRTRIAATNLKLRFNNFSNLQL